MSLERSDRVSRGLLQYGLEPLATAGFFVLVAFLWTFLLQHVFAYPFLFLFFGAVMGSAWFGGTIAGFLSVIFSTLTIAYFFVPPLYSWSIDPAAESYFVAFIICATTVSWVISARKRGETAIREARDYLEQRVLERTAQLQQSYAEVRESELQLRLLTEAIPQQIWSAGTDGLVEYCNQHLLAYTGRSMEEMRGMEFFTVLHPEDLGGLFHQAWQNAFARGVRFEGEWRIAGADGQYHWFLVRGVPQQVGDGRIIRWYGTHIEIEERHRAEQALITAQGELSELSRKLSMGELAASIMHEINQPLTAVVTHAYACREWLRGNPTNLEKASATEKIVEESTRASTVAARVRALFQKEPPEKENLDINSIIQNLARILRDEAIRRDVVIHLVLERNLPWVDVDRVQIEQVLLNLATNGMDAMMEIDGPRELLLASEAGDDKEILVRVEDCGTGLAAGISGRIFEPFFTTKSHGIGMGLSICRSIIEAHDGRLWATARPTGGTIFQFTIPVQP